ncbi:MAG TPA: single-stranded-DNA-specific exonuclease RecJ [Usitatibacter sp.]|jgi:single-stranded-DNA-specific exonuclease|nr:single-stranded-DNA-specific exonuclease RecJ [Usitatibacter sp.]
MPEIVSRPVDEAACARLIAGGCAPRLARIYAARGLAAPAELATTLQSLAAPERLRHVDDAARLLADAIARGERMLIVADYDADGATACAVGVKSLRAMGASVDFLVPNRFEHGYGLTPEIAREAAKRSPSLLITVDNGIAAVEGIAEANRLGMRVLVTDHHLPGSQLPDAACIVNPNQAECGFPSKSLAGVGVIFYVMLALRAELRARGAFGASTGANLAELLDLVALGTVADVVRLDGNNRILVAQGLARIRAGRACPGIAALLELAGRPCRTASAQDLGFAVGPRLNAAGRLQDMSIGIECLLAVDDAHALRLATQLDRLNRERREIEGEMQASALALVASVEATDTYSLSLHSSDWHAGVVGLLASRLKDRFHRPVFAFAADASGKLKGSGRSVPGLHLRDALDLVAKRTPGLLERFGGHAAAAGLTLGPEGLEAFRAAFEQVAREQLTPADLQRRIEIDGELDAAEMEFDFATTLRSQVWGQGFPEPRFAGAFRVESQRVVGEKHMRATLSFAGRRFAAIRFGCADPLPSTLRAVYKLDVNEYQGSSSLQLVIDHVE